ncbi:MAG: TolC family outer membrane protein [Alphaproteobacteria bacterium]|nr:TolC family outer membrane protein [Alphaproteobacteria bacterium]
MRLSHMVSALAAVSLAVCPPIAANAESLKDALALAYSTNPTIRAERSRLKATEEYKAQAWAGALPQLQGSGSYGRTRDKVTFSPVLAPNGSPQTYRLNPAVGTVSGEQVIFNGFKNYNAIMQARARVKAGGARLASVEQDILRRVATAYFDVLRDTAIYQSNLNNVELLQEQKRETDLRFKVGEVTKTDVSQAEARLAGARAGLAGAQAQLAVSRATYAELVGQSPGTLDAAPPLPELPETLDAAIALAGDYAPSVVAAREQAEASRRQIGIAKAELLPKISATAQYQYSDEPNSFINKDETFAYGVRATMPLFLGGRNWSGVRQARALHDSDVAAIDEAIRGATANVTSAWQKLIAAKITIDSATAQVAANKLALEGVKKEAQVGTRSTLDVLNAEQEYLNAKVSLANAERDQRVASFALLAAAGVLTPEALGIDSKSIIPAQD